MPIRIENLRKSFGEPPTDVLKGITATIHDGEMISISGRSGSGKSTLLYVISTLDPATSGDVSIDGTLLSQMSPSQIHHFRNHNMGFVFQFHHLLPELTALENILMPAIKSRSNLQKRGLALDLLKEFGIRGKADHLPSKLSGGEQQRVAIARALIMNPKYIFADEPTGNLDSINGQLVMNLFQRINREYQTTVIYVTHDQLFAKMASRQIHLVDGVLVDSKPTQENHV